MIIEVKIPTIGESVTEAEIAHWLVEDGQYVEKDEEIVEIDSEKATISLSAESSGVIKIIQIEGTTVSIGAIIAEINSSENSSLLSIEKKTEAKINDSETTEKKDISEEIKNSKSPLNLTPLARNILKKEDLDISEEIFNTSKKITKKNILEHIQNKKDRQTDTLKMSMLRKKLAERLVNVKNQTAMLTTFNEVDMSSIIQIRQQYKDIFFHTHQVKLGFMSFFVKAVTKALVEFPVVNAFINEDHIVFNHFSDISIAVSTDKGLMVPVIRNAEKLSIPDIELKIFELSEKARTQKISINEMTGGTFTITNGGVFGSMLSTPIINPPQSAILGMHNIVERAVVVNKEIVIRPIMYVALSYDHRIIDGKESVGFIVKLKTLLENPVLLNEDTSQTIEHLLKL